MDNTLRDLSTTVQFSIVHARDLSRDLQKNQTCEQLCSRFCFILRYPYPWFSVIWLQIRRREKKATNFLGSSFPRTLYADNCSKSSLLCAHCSKRLLFRSNRVRWREFGGNGYEGAIMVSVHLLTHARLTQFQNRSKTG